MKLSRLFARVTRARRPNRRADCDWTQSWSPREWADLPPHHPKRPD